MKICNTRHGTPGTQQGALILVTLLILLIVSILGMSTIDTTGLEMQMSSNSRGQQQAFEAAEYTLSWVENNLAATGYFSDASLTNSACGATCFSNACVNGYCFDGTNAAQYDQCKLNPPAVEHFETAALWATGSGQHQTLAVPNTTITSRYIIEFWCYTSKDDTLPMDIGNNAQLYRITAYAVAEDGRARAMLRSTVKETE